MKGKWFFIGAIVMWIVLGIHDIRNIQRGYYNSIGGEKIYFTKEQPHE